MIDIAPRQLLVRLLGYYAVVVACVAVLMLSNAELLRFLPFGGTDALESAGVHLADDPISMMGTADESTTAWRAVTPGQLGASVLFLGLTLLTTLVVMLPVTWTFLATQHDTGPSRTFVRALLLMPVCTTPVVLLIQDSLPLAFGLAALVAAVRFRVDLPETIDGIYVFVAIGVGLAGGIGHMGIALIMTMIFTLASTVLWWLDYGRNPMDDARRQAAAAKITAKTGASGSPSAPDNPVQ